MNENTKKRSLKLESLESRQMMAGDVDAFALGKFLYIRGDNADNGVAVVDGGGGSISVVGLDQGGATTINGGNVPVNFTKINNIILLLGKGNDAAVVSNINLKGTLTVDGGQGNNAIALGDFDDEDDLFDDAVDAMLGQLTVNKNIMIAGGSTGNSSVYAEAVVAGKSLIISTGNGNDEVQLEGITVAKNLTINTGTGNDEVEIEDLSAKDLNVVLGAGDDELTVEDIAIAKNATFNGASGDNDLTELGTNTYGKKVKRVNFGNVV